LKAELPDTPIIGFTRGAGDKYTYYVEQVEVYCVAFDKQVISIWAAENLQPKMCVQGNLDQTLLVSGGDKLVSETKRVVDAFKGGPHIFNLGHGITPDASPDHVSQMIEAIRG
jgi:uroporphyrinogen decarboxylase